jgi:ankyrin repeat protein
MTMRGSQQSDISMLNAELCDAALKCDVVRIKSALAAGADPNARESGRGYTPLHEVAVHGSQAAVRALAEAGALFATRDHYQRLPLDVAMQFYDGIGKEEFCVWLARQDEQAASTSGSAVATAAQLGLVKLFDELIRLGCSIDSRGIGGHLPMHAVAESGSVEGAKRLFALGVGVDGVDRYNQTPLHAAIFRGNCEVAKWMLSVGADPNVLQASGYGPLHSAAFADAGNIVDPLLACNADPTAKNKHGQTPFDLAIKRGAVSVMVALEAAGHGHAMDQQELNDRLADAAKEGQATLVGELLQRGADATIRPNGRTLLQHAKNSSAEVKQLILTARAGDVIGGAVGMAATGEGGAVARPSPAASL